MENEPYGSESVRRMSEQTPGDPVKYGATRRRFEDANRLRFVENKNPAGDMPTRAELQGLKTKSQICFRPNQFFLFCFSLKNNHKICLKIVFYFNHPF